jgi:hypothetical protein
MALQGGLYLQQLIVALRALHQTRRVVTSSLRPIETP